MLVIVQVALFSAGRRALRGKPMQPTSSAIEKTTPPNKLAPARTTGETGKVGVQAAAAIPVPCVVQATAPVNHP